MEVQQDYQQIKPIPAQEIEENQKDNECCFHFFCWVFQVLVWGFLLTSIILVCIKNSAYIITFSIYGFFHLAYICIEIFSSTFIFLLNKRDMKGLKETLRAFIATPPVIEFYGRSYHIAYAYNGRDSNGKEEYKEYEDTTHEERYKMPYYSARDVSGPLHLNCQKEDLQKKRYIKLKLSVEVNFADTLSDSDYRKEICDFNRRNMFLDEYYTFSENQYLPGLIKYNFIILGDSDPCIVHYCFFLLSTLLTFAEFYKSYVNSLCINQKYKIRKLVSTRYDLSQPIFDDKYDKFNPQIDIISETCFYEPQDFNYLNTEYKPKIPTQEEIEEEKKQQNPSGIVLDLPVVNYNTNPVQDNQDIYTDEQNNEDENSGINIQMVEKKST